MKLFLAFPALVLLAIPSWAATCESLASLALPNTTITLAQPVAAGEFTPPGRTSAEDRARRGVQRSARILPRRRDLEADRATPISRSKSGCPRRDGTESSRRWATADGPASISYGAMAEALHDGYATSSTDTGHVGGSGSFALGHPEKLIDFGYRSEHEMTVKSKAMIEAFYGMRREDVLLEWLLHRRPPGIEGSAAISGRL